MTGIGHWCLIKSTKACTVNEGWKKFRNIPENYEWEIGIEIDFL